MPWHLVMLVNWDSAHQKADLFLWSSCPVHHSRKKKQATLQGSPGGGWNSHMWVVQKNMQLKRPTLHSAAFFICPLNYECTLQHDIKGKELCVRAQSSFVGVFSALLLSLPSGLSYNSWLFRLTWWALLGWPPSTWPTLWAWDWLQSIVGDRNNHSLMGDNFKNGSGQHMETPETLGGF